MSIGVHLSTTLSVIQECLIFIYFANSTLVYRKSRFNSNSIAVIGYLIHAVICLFGHTNLNLISNFVMLFAIIILGYREKIWSAALKTFLLLAFMMVGEALFMVAIGIHADTIMYKELPENFHWIFAISSKWIYFLLVFILKRFMRLEELKGAVKEQFLLLVFPAATIVFMFVSDTIINQFSFYKRWWFLCLYILVIAANYAVCVVYDMIADKNAKIRHLQEVEHKNKMDYRSYELLREKYDELRIMVHDFNKYYSSIEGLLSDRENTDEVMNLVRDLRNKSNEFLLVEYTENKALNIILSQKMAECNHNGIDLQVSIQDVDISFISETDMVAIFANLLDNSIESAACSEGKRISMDIYTMNGAYAVIRLDNSCDAEPEVKNDRLLTRKRDKESHGIGMESIRKALKNYSGSLRWSYNKDSRTFTTIILINLPD